MAGLPTSNIYPALELNITFPYTFQLRIADNRLAYAVLGTTVGLAGLAAFYLRRSEDVRRIIRNVIVGNDNEQDPAVNDINPGSLLVDITCKAERSLRTLGRRYRNGSLDTDIENGLKSIGYNTPITVTAEKDGKPFALDKVLQVHSMEKTDRERIRRNRVALLNDMVTPDDVIDYLYSKGIFTDSTKEDAQACPTWTKKVEKILDTVPRRGKQAIHVFYDALVETEQGHLADLLFPERIEERLAKEAARAPPTSTPCPANTQSVNTPPLVTQPVQPEEEDVQLPELPCDAGQSLVFPDSLKFDLSDSVLRLQEKYSQVYKNANANKGRALIILNIKMEGRDILRTNLTRLLKKLGYKVDHKKNLKAEKIKDVLRSEAQNVEHRDAESFICIFIGYGKGGIFTGKDGKTISLSEVTCFFNGQNCSSLVNKPKLFLAQTCVDCETNKIEGETEEVMEQLTADLRAATLRDSGEGAVATDSVPTMADIFVAACTEYNSSTETGHNFWFLEALVYVFCTFAHSDSLNSMLTKINRILSKKHAALDYQSSSLRKEFYFFPKRPVTSDNDSCQQNDAVESATGGRSSLAQASCGDDTAQLVLG